MIVYIVTLLLLSSRSFGSPVTNTNISTALDFLAKRCENSVLPSLIKTKIAECSVVSPSYKEKKQFECLIFFDINTQLCNAVASNHLNVHQEDTDKIMEPVDVGQLCTSAKDWKALLLPEYPLYKVTVEKVFNSEINCAKVCGVEDVTSQDSNFFCKYYKWGMEMLARPIFAAQQPTSNISLGPAHTQIQQVSGLPSELGGASIASSVNTSNPAEVNLPTSKLVDEQSQNVVEQQSQKVVEPHQQVNLEPVKQDGAEEEVSFQRPPPENQPQAAENAVIPPVVSSQAQNATQAAVLSKDVVNSAESLDKPSAADFAKVDKVEKSEEPIQADQITQKEKAKGKSQANADVADYQDDEDRQQDFGDTQAGEDMDPDNLGDIDDKVRIDQTKSIASKTFKDSISPYMGETDGLSSNNIMPEYSDDDEDHFFSFFLTVIIMVVLLYILYHNKNKVSKVFFGLIVEGRQGRRRNSRGHAYRRLDTLEQAMSTNSAAPPSKIIY